MSSFFTILLIGISLSMDAFSLALVYGIFLYSKKRKLLLKVATNETNLASINHQYDMLFVSSIDLETLSEEKLNMSIIDGETYGINSSYALVGIIFVLFGLIAIIRLSNLVYKITATASLYDKKLQRILREYDRLIVISRGDYIVDESKRLIKVTSFRELLDARNTLEKPIVYVRINNVNVSNDVVIFIYWCF
mgnify:CR=1 FL=1